MAKHEDLFLFFNVMYFMYEVHLECFEFQAHTQRDKTDFESSEMTCPKYAWLFALCYIVKAILAYWNSNAESHPVH